MAPRRSPRLHPQFHANEEGAGMAQRRSSRLRPQIPTGEDGARVTRRIRRRRGRGTSPAAASLPDNDDLLREILTRLPPQPSSLPRASAVCRRWRGIVTDPKFHRQYYAHHRKPPLLGFFERNHEGIVFTPMLDPPHRIPPQHFNLGRCSSREGHNVLDCRHGLVLVLDTPRTEVVVCDPITREQHHLPIPTEFKTHCLNGVVLCAAGDQGHVHGGCHSSPFKVVLMSTYNTYSQPLARVYSSVIGGWGNVISTAAPYQPGYYFSFPATLVGNALYWLSRKDEIVEFDLDGQSLAVILGPPVDTNDPLCLSHRIIRAEDCSLGFAVLSFPHLIMWRRNANGHGVATWVSWKTIEMRTILGLPSQIEVGRVLLLGYGEDTDVVFLLVGVTVYMVELESMQSRKLKEVNYITLFHPFMSFYTPGTAINGGSNGPEMLHNA